MLNNKMFRLPGPVSVSQLFLTRLLRFAVVGGIFCLILFALVPSNPHNKKESLHLPQQRRIQQALKNIPEGSHLFSIKATNASSTGTRDVPLGKNGPLPSEETKSAYSRRHFQPINLIYDTNYSLPLIDTSKLSGLPYQLSSKIVIEGIQKAQMTAIAMKEQGLRITQEQENLIKDINNDKKEQIKEKIYTIRKQQEISYFRQLRARGQIQQVPSGGERILSSPYKPVRFPASLKKIRPEKWEKDYKLYFNLTYYPWARTAGCRDYTTIFAPPGSLQTAALASFPSSGNTWIRYLIESASGIFTGSLYDDSSLTRKGLYGEGVIYDSGMTILQKTHGYTTGASMHLSHKERLKLNHMEELNHYGVLIIRNPFKALISHRHLDVGGHTGYAPKSHFINQGWKDFVKLKIKLWKEFYIDWLESTRPSDLHIVIYEDLISEPLTVIRKIMKFMALPIDETRLECLSQYPDGVFKRKPSKNMPNDLNPYNQSLKDLIYAAIDELNEVLLKKGKAELPTERYDIYNIQEAKVSRRLRAQRILTTE